MAPELYSASAPGSLMLLGEHAVLRKNQAIVAAINKRITVTVTPQPGDSITIRSSEFAEFNCSLATIAVVEPYKYVLAAILSFHVQLATGFIVDIRAEFAPDLGLGSSAAVSVATVAVFSQWLGLQYSKENIFQHAKKIILAVQGKGSGADLAASIYGGVLHFCTDPFAIEHLPLITELTVVYSGKKLKTTAVLDLVADLATRAPGVTDNIFASINACVTEAVAAFKAHDWPLLGVLWSIQHGLLAALHLSNPLLDSISARLLELGALGAKISGSGLGDCVIAIGKLQASGDALLPEQLLLQGAKPLAVSITATGLQYE